MSLFAIDNIRLYCIAKNASSYNRVNDDDSHGIGDGKIKR